MECYILNPALSLLMKHLLIYQYQKAPKFYAFPWSPHSSLVSIGQLFITTRVVHLPIRTQTSLITEADLTTESHHAVRALHSCNSWLFWVFNFLGYLLGRSFIICFISSSNPMSKILSASSMIKHCRFLNINPSVF